MCRKKNVLLPRRKVQRSQRNVIPAPTGAAELLDVMTGGMETNAFEAEGVQIYEAESVHYYGGDNAWRR